MHPKDIEKALYVFLDAEISGYGISFQLPQNKVYNPDCLMQLQAGLLGINISKSSSNHREFWKLFKSVEDAVIDGQLTNLEFFH